MIFTFLDFPDFFIFFTPVYIFVTVFWHLLECSIVFMSSISLSANCLAAVNKSEFAIDSLCRIISYFSIYIVTKYNEMYNKYKEIIINKKANL